ncbi:MAG: hypothetical protein ACM3SP_20000 [Chloroflexota bacterium]
MSSDQFSLFGFDLDLIGFDCAREVERDAPWRCPFVPGCGGVPGKDCPLMQRRAQIGRAPDRQQ